MMQRIGQFRWAAIAIAVCGGWFSVAGFSPTADSAVIVNSGSTNRAGFRIVVERSGNAEYTAMPRGINPQPAQPESAKAAHRPVADALVQRLYSDLEAAKPLASLPQPRCMKSASFGFRLTIEFGSLETPDLSCGDGNSPKLSALIRDANEIVALFSAK
jgi:hypothetical protein